MSVPDDERGAVLERRALLTVTRHRVDLRRHADAVIARLQHCERRDHHGVVGLGGVVQVGEARVDLAQAADELRGDLAEWRRPGKALEIAVDDVARRVATLGIAAGRSSVGAGRRLGACRFGARRRFGAYRFGACRSFGARWRLGACRFGAGRCAAVGRAVVITAAGCGGEGQRDQQCTNAHHA